MGMRHLFPRVSCAVLAAVLLLAPASNASQEQQKRKKKPVRNDVLNFDGGIVFETDGSLSEQTCFRVAGRVTAPEFFDKFERIDTEQGTEYRSGQTIVTEFPEQVHVSFIIFDLPCASQMQEPGPRRYLTMDMMKSLRFQFYWKRGIELRRVENLKQLSATAEPVEPYNTESKEELQKRFRWFIDFTIPSGGVPLTDRLVLIIRTADERRAARVAARL
jgi:hypothetical protein